VGRGGRRARPRSILPCINGIGASDEAGPDNSEWLNRLESTQNLLPALDWLTETGNAIGHCALGHSPFFLWETREYLTKDGSAGQNPQNWKEWWANRRAAGEPFAAGVLAGEPGDYASADTLVDESLRIASNLGDERGGRR